ncbi:MAG TPA: hypothetical protein DIT89_02125 [Planctomycetaceae bacterium]|nr:hypothetical protein [Planctomycetaceae bacterium]
MKTVLRRGQGTCAIASGQRTQQCTANRHACQFATERWFRAKLSILPRLAGIHKLNRVKKRSLAGNPMEAEFRSSAFQGRPPRSLVSAGRKVERQQQI